MCRDESNGRGDRKRCQLDRIVSDNKKIRFFLHISQNEKMYRAMYARHQYDSNSKTALSTDVSPRKIRDICNKK